MGDGRVSVAILNAKAFSLISTSVSVVVSKSRPSDNRRSSSSVDSIRENLQNSQKGRVQSTSILLFPFEQDADAPPKVINLLSISRMQHFIKGSP